MSAFSCIPIDYLSIDLSSSAIEKFEKRLALEPAKRKIYKINEFTDTIFLIYK